MLDWWNVAESVSKFEQAMVMAVISFAALTFVAICLGKKGGKKNSADKTNIDARTVQQLKVREGEVADLRAELLSLQKERDTAARHIKEARDEITRLNQALKEAHHNHGRNEAQNDHGRKEAHKNHGRKERPNDHGRTRELSPPQKKRPTPAEPKPASPKNDLRMGADQREQLIGLLDPGPKGEIDIISSMGNEVSHLLALELEALFKSDGWTTKKVVQSSFAKVPEGLILAVHSRETAPSYAPFIQRSFTTLGFPVSAAVNKKHREWSLTLIVGDVGKYL